MTGFVGEETLASATTGTLLFSSPQENTGTAGRFAINGSGLMAANYVLQQAAANALTINARPVEVAPLEATLIRAPLADAPGCASAEQAANGQCLMVTPITTSLNISNARVVERAPVAVPPALPPTPPRSPDPAAATATATATATEPAPAPAVPAAAQQPAPPPAAVMPLAIAAPDELQIKLPAPRQVRTATLPQIERKIAVLIGIDKYKDSRIPNLNNAVADARAVAAALESNLGYQTLVLANPTRATIFRTLNQLAAEVGPADSVVLYYAGHGELVEKTGLGYWPAADADASRPETWISNADVGRMLRQLPASQLAMVSDSCFSGSLVSGDRIRGVSGSQDPSTLLSRRAAVVMSSGGNEPVFDSGKNGHSTFAWSLMQSLEQVSGWKPRSSLFEQVRFAVARQLPQRPQYGASQAGGHEAGGTRAIRPSMRPAGSTAKPAGPGKASLLITFATGSSDLTSESQQVLGTVAKALQSDRLAGFAFKVEGHADPRGTADMNLKLSEERANSVVAYLTGKLSVLPDRLKAVGKGDTEPLNTERPDAQENRRVTIVTTR